MMPTDSVEKSMG